MPLIGDKVGQLAGNKVGRLIGTMLGKNDGDKDMGVTGLQEGLSNRGEMVGPRVGVALGELE